MQRFVVSRGSLSNLCLPSSYLDLNLSTVPVIPAVGDSSQEDLNSCSTVSLKDILENEVWIDEFWGRMKLELKLGGRRVEGSIHIFCIYLTEHERKGKKKRVDSNWEHILPHSEAPSACVELLQVKRAHEMFVAALQNTMNCFRPQRMSMRRLTKQQLSCKASSL